MTRPTVHDGWLIVPCDAPDTTSVAIKVVPAQSGRTTRPDQTEWQPAFRDWHDGTRVAKIRHTPSGRAAVHLRVGGTDTYVGTVTP